MSTERRRWPLCGGGCDHTYIQQVGGVWVWAIATPTGSVLEWKRRIPIDAGHAASIEAEIKALRAQVARLTAERDAYRDAGFAMASVCRTVALGHGGALFMFEAAESAVAKFDEAHDASAKGADR